MIARVMARPLGIEFEGALCHVTLRGNARQSIFLKDSDRSDFLDTLAGVVDTGGSATPTISW